MEVEALRPADDVDAPVSLDFEDWVGACAGSLMSFAYVVTGDRDAAQEALQEALASALGHWARILRADDPEAYVRRMVVNAHISWWRRRRRETPVGDLHDGLGGTDPDSADHDVEGVWQLCATLAPRQRAAIVLRFYEGLSYAEVASLLGVSEVTARTQTHRALANLRTRLVEAGDVDG
jgi:RNA polymerase sigma-70 factor (sigma-E family)